MARKNVIQLTNNSNTLIGFIYISIKTLFECKLKSVPKCIPNAFELIIDIFWLSSVKKDYLLSLFWWIWIEGHFPFIGQRPTLSRSLFSFCEVLMGSLITENIYVSSAKSFTLVSRLPNKSLIYIIKNNGLKNAPQVWSLLPFE